LLGCARKIDDSIDLTAAEPHSANLTAVKPPAALPQFVRHPQRRIFDHAV